MNTGQTLLQSAILAYKSNQTDVGKRKAATRKRLTDKGRKIAVCTAKSVLGIDIDPQSVRVEIVEVTALGAVSDEGFRRERIEFTVEAEYGPLEFSVKEDREDDNWSAEGSMLAVHGPSNTRYSTWRVRDLAGLGEFAEAVLTQKETADEQ